VVTRSHWWTKKVVRQQRNDQSHKNWLWKGKGKTGVIFFKYSAINTKKLQRHLEDRAKLWDQNNPINWPVRTAHAVLLYTLPLPPDQHHKWSHLRWRHCYEHYYCSYYKHFVIYTVGHKKFATFIFMITLVKMERFHNSFTFFIKKIDIITRVINDSV